MSACKTLLITLLLAVSGQALAANTKDDSARLLQEHQQAVEEYARAHGKAVPAVEPYRYGMSLDIQKVIRGARPAEVCGVVPARMSYLDSRGELRTIEYRTRGAGCPFRKHRH